MVMAKVGIVVISFNRPTYLIQAIESILWQTFQDFHIYIMDNNSDDCIKDVLKQYEKHQKISIYFTNTKDEERNIHWDGILINRAFHMGKEEYLMMLNDDCFLEKNTFELLVKKLDENLNMDIVYGAEHEINPDGNPYNIYGEATSIGFGNKRDKVISQGQYVLNAAQIMFRRSLYEKIGDFWEGSFIYSPDEYFFKKLQHNNILIYPVYAYTSTRIHQRKGQRQFIGKGKGIIMEEKPLAKKIKIQRNKNG